MIKQRRHHSLPLFIGIIVCLFLPSAAFAEHSEETDSKARARMSEIPKENTIEQRRLSTRLSNAQSIFLKLLNGPDGGIPEQLLKKSNCIAVLPDVLKAAFVVGGEFGRGVLSCKSDSGEWSAPAFVELRAASFGWQIGGKSTDLVLFFAGEKTQQVLSSSKFTLGADIGVAAGPVGRRAEGNLGTAFDGVYSYAHTEGLFVGLALNGAELLSDSRANVTYYSSQHRLTQFVLKNIPIGSLPPEARSFITALPQ